MTTDHYQSDDLIGALRMIDSMPKPRIDKCNTFAMLARAVKKGCIIELGTYRGIGAVALAYGAFEHNIKVFTVDDYTHRTGWSGEKYKPEDRDEFFNNISLMKSAINLSEIIQVKESVSAAAKLRIFPTIGMIVWDAGGSVLKDHLDEWNGLVKPGCEIAVHDTSEGLFMAKKILRDMCEYGGFEDYRYFTGDVHVIRRSK